MTNSTVWLALSSAITMMLAGPAAAETNGKDEIVVVGNKTIKEAVGDFIDTTIARPTGGRNVGQYARFGAPICPATFGFSENNNMQITNRIRNIALSAQIPLAEPDCQPNIYVVVIDEGKSAISQLRNKHHRIFGQLPIYRRAQLEDAPGPVFGWKSIVSHAAKGRGSRIVEDGSSFVGTGHAVGSAATPNANEIATARVDTGSLIKKPVQQIIQRAFLLLEDKALIGMTTVQIADFAAMFNFVDANKSVDEQMAPGSILTLFNPTLDEKGRPDSIGEWDLIMLSALYHSPLNVSAPLQRSAMQQRIVKEIELDN